MHKEDIIPSYKIEIETEVSTPRSIEQNEVHEAFIQSLQPLKEHLLNLKKLLDK
jgi:hypothetical protein